MIYRCTPGFIHWHWIWKRKSKHILNAFVPMGGRFMGTKMYKVTLVWEPVGPVGYQTNPERRHWSLPFFEWFGFYATWGLPWFTVVYQLLSSHPESFPTLGCGDPCLGGVPGTPLADSTWSKLQDPAVLDVFWCFWYLFLIRFSRDTRYTMVYRKQKASDPWLIHLIPRSRQSTYGFQKLACEYFAKGAWEQHQRLGGVGRRFPLKSGLCHQIAVLIGENAEELVDLKGTRVPCFQTKPCCDVSWPKWPHPATIYWTLDLPTERTSSSENCPEFIRVPLSDWIVLYP